MRLLSVTTIGLSALICLSAVCSAKDSTTITNNIQVQQSPWSVIAEFWGAKHNADFANMPGVESCCSEYRAGLGTGMSILTSYSLSGSDTDLGLHLSGGLSWLGAPMSTITDEVVDYRGSAVTAEIRHDLTMSYWQGFIGLSGSYRAMPCLNITIGLAGSIPISLSYQTSETLLSPQGLIYETGTRVRNETSGRSPSARASILAPIVLEGPVMMIGTSVYMQPRVGFTPWLTSVNSAVNWSVYSVSAGIRVGLYQQITIVDTQYVDVVSPAPMSVVETVSEKLTQRISVQAGVRDKASGALVTQVRISHNVKHRRLALLPSVFFDSAKADIPNRFLARRVSSSDNIIGRVDDIDVSHSVIHIIGTTLQQQPSATVLITGSHAEDGPLGDRQQLASDRAEGIKRYLMDNYGIVQERIRTKARALPERASGASTPYARSENRRADFELTYAEVNLPVQQDTFAVDSIESVEISIGCARPESLGLVSVSILADGNVIAKREATATAKDFVVIVPLGGGASNALVSAESVEVEVLARDSEDGLIKERIKAFDLVSEPSQEGPLDEFGIVLFDYNSSRIADSERRVFDELRKRAAGATRIIITGTSDESGLEAINRKLAEDRALSVARELRLKEGTYELRSRIATDYSSIIPEGRMLGRQVRVVFQNEMK